MATAKLTNVKSILFGGEPRPGEHRQLVKETLLLTLAHATRSDTNIQRIEVDTVRNIIGKATGEQISEADVRVAAHSDLFENSSLEECLGRVRSKLTPEDRTMIVGSLADVIRSDLRVEYFEVAFFNDVAKALDVAPNEVARLLPD